LLLETSITRSTALLNAGRSIEAEIGLRGALLVADRLGDTFAALRTRNNLLGVLEPGDLEATLALTREMYDIAQRFGQRTWVQQADRRGRFEQLRRRPLGRLDPRDGRRGADGDRALPPLVPMRTGDPNGPPRTGRRGDPDHRGGARLLSLRQRQVVLLTQGDFAFHGSDTLMIYVLYNLIRNALAAVENVAHGRIENTPAGRQRHQHGDHQRHRTRHTRACAAARVRSLYTTKATRGTGMGLAFCLRVITAFGGTIRCRSREGAFTMMALEFPAP